MKYSAISMSDENKFLSDINIKIHIMHFQFINNMHTQKLTYMSEIVCTVKEEFVEDEKEKKNIPKETHSVPHIHNSLLPSDDIFICFIYFL